MNQRTTAAVRTPTECTTPFEVVTGVRQWAVAGPLLFKLAIDHTMRRTVDQYPSRYHSNTIRTPFSISSGLTMLLYSQKAVRNFNMLSTLYRSWLQPLDYVYALINASICGSPRDLERESGWTDNR
ncbi:hypothetical protein RB195_001725 [Necator americanus]|uniref:Uncharacterized protein n=1 Tax=Necator americanus TaxID=51031 RepID=A0ABR1DH76_NECAM